MNLNFICLKNLNPADLMHQDKGDTWRRGGTLSEEKGREVRGGTLGSGGNQEGDSIWNVN